LPLRGQPARLTQLPVEERRPAARALAEAAIADLRARGEPVTALAVQRRAGLSPAPMRAPDIQAAVRAAERRSIEETAASVRLPREGGTGDLRSLPPSHRPAVTARLVELAVAELRAAGAAVYREAVQRRTGLSDTALRGDAVRQLIADAATPRSARHARTCEERRERLAKTLDLERHRLGELTQSEVARLADVPETFARADGECQRLFADAGVAKRRHPIPVRQRLTDAILELGPHRPWPLSPGDVCDLAEAPPSSLDAQADLRALVDDPELLVAFLADRGVHVELPEKRQLALAEEQHALAVLRELDAKGEAPSRTAVARQTGFTEARLRRFPRFERLRAALLGQGDAAIDTDVRRLGLDRLDGLDTVGTRRDYARRVKRFEDWAEREGRAAHPITRAVALEFLAVRQDAGVQENTLQADKQALNAVARAHGYAVPLPGKHGPRLNRLSEAVTRAYAAAAEFALDPTQPKPGVEARREQAIDDGLGLEIYRERGLLGREPGRALVFEGADGETVRAVVACEPPDALAWLDAELAEMQRRPDTKSTYEVYKRRMSHFLAFCDLFEKSPLPARVETVRRFLCWLGAGFFDGEPKGKSVLEQCVAAIAYAHRRHGIASPTADPSVTDTLAALQRRFGRPTSQSAPITLEDLAKLVEAMDASGTVRAVRDKAWLLLTFGAAARVSQTTTRRGMDFDDEAVVTLKWNNLRFHGHRQIEICIERAKNRAPGDVPPKFVDQSSFNCETWTSPTCPVRALLDWREMMAQKLGWIHNDTRLQNLPVFPRLRPIGPRHLGDVRVIDEPVSKSQMAEIFKNWAVLAELPRCDMITSHSLKIGHINTALEGGAGLEIAADQADHKSLETTRSYNRGRDRSRNNSSQHLEY
jgi:hypothetical protein